MRSTSGRSDNSSFIRSGARAASYDSASEETSSSEDEPSPRKTLKSSVAAVVKPRKDRSPSSSRSEHSHDSEDEAPTPERRHKTSKHSQDTDREERKRRHDSKSSNDGYRDDNKRSRSKYEPTKDRDSSRKRNYDRLDEYDRYHRDHYGDSDDNSRYDNKSRRSRKDDDREDSRKQRKGREDEIERRRIEREKRHRKQEEDRRRDEEKENVDVSERSRKRKVDETSPGRPDKPADGEDDDEAYIKAKRAKAGAGGGDESLTTKTGGAYIPPARLRMMQAAITDKSSAQYQRISWEALKKSVNGLINKVNVSNMIDIVRELFQENIVRARGVLAKAVVAAQAASPTFTHVYASMVAIINTKFPQIGELILKRLIIQFKKGYRRNNKDLCLSSVRFLAHLVNQQVAHEIIALEILTLLLENPTDDSVEVTVGFLKECGQKLTEVSPRGINAIFERLRGVLHESQVDKRVQYMIEVMFAIRKDGFKDHIAVQPELDLVEEDDQFTHMLTLDDAVNSEDILNVFKVDPDFEANEEKYKVLKKEILDEGSSGSESGSGSGSDSDSEDESQDEEAKTTVIDATETNLVAFRRTVYLTIQSSLDFEECAHKMLRMDIKPRMEEELCNMILDCCAQNRTYEKFFGLLAQRFCMIDKKYIEPCQKIFKDQYETCHRLETNKLRNISRFFAHLLHTDAISWEVMQHIRLNEDDTTSSSRIFIKILFQELSEYMGLPKLHDRLLDATLAPYFEGLLPRDNPKNTRFSINFFTSIGLGGLTDELRAHLKTMPKSLPKPEPEPESESDSSSSSSSSDSSSSSSSSSDSDSDSSSSSESEKEKKPKRKKKTSEKQESSKESRLSRREALKLECQRLEELCLKKRKNKEPKPDDEYKSRSEAESRKQSKDESRYEHRNDERNGRSSRKQNSEVQKVDKHNGYREDYDDRDADRYRNGERYRDKVPRERREDSRERLESSRDRVPQWDDKEEKYSRNRQEKLRDNRDESRDRGDRYYNNRSEKSSRKHDEGYRDKQEVRDPERSRSDRREKRR